MREVRGRADGVADHSHLEAVRATVHTRTSGFILETNPAVAHSRCNDSSPKVLLLHLKRFIVEERQIISPAAARPIGEENIPPNVDQNAAGDSKRPLSPTIEYSYVFEKNRSAVDIPAQLSLDEFSIEALDDPAESSDLAGSTRSSGNLSTRTRYQLASVVHHIGTRAESGHYTADAIRWKNDKRVHALPASLGVGGSNQPNEEEEGATEEFVPSWINFDDGICRVQPSEGKVMLLDAKKQRTAYMLLYTLGDLEQATR
jgi:Ubiquitin carboxyl-terminal hydrolase